MAAPVILFDFDGTIADTLTCLWQIGQHLALEAGYPSLPPLEKLRDMHSQEILEVLGIPVVQLPWVVRRLRRELSRRMGEVRLCGGMDRALASLYGQGWTLGIVTSNSSRNVRAFLRQHQMEDWFAVVHSESALLGKSRILRRLVRQHQWGDVVYVGDETRDVVAAKSAGLPVIAVAWGFNTVAALQAACPQAVALDAEQLLGILNRWWSPQNP
ncbi:MAG: HAD-IA family hydrolase [Thermostichales cyanobacterium GMQP_bins_62]